MLAVPAALSAFMPQGAPELSDRVTTNLVFVSAAFSVPVVGGELMTNGSIFKRSKRRSRAIPALFALGAAIAALFAFVPFFAASISADTLSLRLFLYSLIPAVTALFVFEMIKVTTKKNKMTEDEKNNLKRRQY